MTTKLQRTATALSTLLLLSLVALPGSSAHTSSALTKSLAHDACEGPPAALSDMEIKHDADLLQIFDPNPDGVSVNLRLLDLACNKAGGGGSGGGNPPPPTTSPDLVQDILDLVPPTENSTEECDGLTLGGLQCVWAWSATSRTDPRSCGLPYATPELACFELMGGGGGQAFLLGGSAAGNVFGTHGSCDWVASSVGWNGCDIGFLYDLREARPGTAACTFTQVTSVAYFVLTTASTSDCH